MVRGVDRDQILELLRAGYAAGLAEFDVTTRGEIFWPAPARTSGSVTSPYACPRFGAAGSSTSAPSRAGG